MFNETNDLSPEEEQEIREVRIKRLLTLLPKISYQKVVTIRPPLHCSFNAKLKGLTKG